ncbi:unnamed protein product [Haemonchus placei]|uniref:Glycosyltransferase 25 family member 3 n=1 Tax=Haemonchus placei TaxID=6290 RepID=A0A0N4WEI2_HAEPC|nr:unnamed protein product [Haemonchus placei]
MWPRFLAFWLLAWIQPAYFLFPGAVPDEGDVRHLYPITHISIGLDNHAHMLPYLFGWLENIDYPKDRLRITLYQLSKDDVTENQHSDEQLCRWKNSVSSLFASVTVVVGEENWLEAGLRAARLRKASRVLLMTGDALPFRGTLLQDLNSTAVVMSALFSPTLSSEISNCATVDDDYRDREVIERRKISEAVLPMLINLDTIDSSYLTFDSDNLPNYLGSGDPSEFRYLLADIVADGGRLPLASKFVRPWTPEPQLWDVEKIYMINLKRRPERRARMERIFEILGVDATYWEATDGQNLPTNYQYRILPGYMDPYHKRPIKAGEIGCFLSHYRIWQDVVQLGLSRIVVFEDDLRFTDGGLERIKEVLEDLDVSKMEWDLIYLGRKKQADQEELWVRNHRHLSTVGYSYWTLGYILSAEGARRLIDAKPLEKLLPVDEYFPIMFNKHPNKEWMSHFPVRNLRAFTLYPLSVFPQRYTHEEGYVSDTEDSKVVKDEVTSETQLKKDEL